MLNLMANSYYHIINIIVHDVEINRPDAMKNFQKKNKKKTALILFIVPSLKKKSYIIECR